MSFEKNNVFNFPRGLFLFYRTNRVESDVTVAILAQGTVQAMRSRSLLFVISGFLENIIFEILLLQTNVFNFPRGLCLFYRANRVESDVTVAILAQGTVQAMRSRSLLFVISGFLENIIFEILLLQTNVFNFPRGLFLFYRTNRVESDVTVAILAQGTVQAMRSRSLLFVISGFFRKHYF